jgi:hypothetical protein
MDPRKAGEMRSVNVRGKEGNRPFRRLRDHPSNEMYSGPHILTFGLLVLRRWTTATRHRPRTGLTTGVLGPVTRPSSDVDVSSVNLGHPPRGVDRGLSISNTQRR